DLEAARPRPGDLDRAFANLLDRRPEVARAGKLGRLILVEGPPAARGAVPDRAIARADRRGREAPEPEDVPGPERQPHDAVAGETLTGAGRQRGLAAISSAYSAGWRIAIPSQRATRAAMGSATACLRRSMVRRG